MTVFMCVYVCVNSRNKMGKKLSYSDNLKLNKLSFVTLFLYYLKTKITFVSKFLYLGKKYNSLNIINDIIKNDWLNLSLPSFKFLPNSV